MKAILFRMLLAGIAATSGCRGAQSLKPAPDRPVVAGLSTSETYIGQTVVLRAAVRVPEGATVVWPSPVRSEAMFARDLGESRDGRTAMREWQLIPLRPGTIVVWTDGVSVALGESTNVLPVPLLELRVRRRALDETNLALRDISGLERWPERPWVRLGLVIGLIALLALMAALLARTLRRSAMAPPPPPPLPPHEQAMRALRELRARGIPEGEAVESFYVDLSAVVRRYLEEAFGLRAPEQTTEEFIRSAAESNALTIEHRTLVFAFLEQSDLVKFARYRPTGPDIEAALAAAERLVAETMPKSEEETGPSKSGARA